MSKKIKVINLQENNVFAYKAPIRAYSLTVIIFLICALPAMLNWGFKQHTYSEHGPSLSFALRSTEYVCSLVAAISITIPVFFSFFLNFMSKELRSPHNIVSLHWILALLIPTILILTIIYPLDLPTFLPAILSCQKILYFHIFCGYLSSALPDFWTLRCWALIGTIFSSIVIYFCYCPFCEFPLIMDVLSLCSLLVIMLVISYSFILWIRRDVWNKGVLKLNAQELCIFTYFLGFCCIVLGNWLLFLNCGFKHFLELDGVCLSSSYLLFTFVIIIVSASQIHILSQDFIRKSFDSKLFLLRRSSKKLRSSLTSLSLGLKVLTDEKETPRNAFDRLQRIRKLSTECNKAVSTMDDIISFDKMEFSYEIPTMSLCKAWSFLRDAVRPLIAQGLQSKIKVNVAVTPAEMSELDQYNIKADKASLTQVVRTLLSNALKFSPIGSTVTIAAHRLCLKSKEVSRRGVRLLDSLSQRSVFLGNHPSQKINQSLPQQKQQQHQQQQQQTPRGPTPSSTPSIKIEGGGDWSEDIIEILRIQVTDSGPGLSKERQERMFQDMIYAASHVEDYDQSSGLSLWIAGGVIALHKGKISVTSEGEGRGCTFTIDLPLYRIRTPTHSHRLTSSVRAVALLSRSIIPVPSDLPYRNRSDGEDINRNVQTGRNQSESNICISVPPCSAASSTANDNQLYGSSPCQVQGQGHSKMLTDHSRSMTSAELDDFDDPFKTIPNSTTSYTTTTTTSTTHNNNMILQTLLSCVDEEKSVDVRFSPSTAVTKPSAISSKSQQQQQRPLLQVESMKEEHDDETYVFEAFDRSKSSIKLMLVDGDLVHRKMLARLSSKYTSSVFEASTGEEIVQLISDEKAEKMAQNGNANANGNGKMKVKAFTSSLFDVIIMNYDLDKMSGVETARKLRMLGFIGKLLLVISEESLSIRDGNPSEKGHRQIDITQCFGVDQILFRPIDKSELGELLCN